MSLISAIKQLYEEKPSNLEGEAGDIHPIYEALVSLLKTQVSDDIARKRLVRGKKEDLKTIILADAMLERVKNPAHRANLLDRLAREEDPYKVAESAAALLAEDKRFASEGALIKLSSLPAESRSYFIKNSKEVVERMSQQIYFTQSASAYMASNTNRFKLKDIKKYLLIGGISLSFIIGSSIFFHYYDLKLERTPKIISQQNK
jgi:hypothetical protein